MNAPANCGRRVCAWCVPMRDLGPEPELPAGVSTHGICDACLGREIGAVGVATNSPKEGAKP